MNLKQIAAHLDRLTAVATVLLGLALLVMGWLGVSRTGLASEQMPYIVSGGLGGICLVAIGTALWLSADLRDEWTKLDRIERVLRDHWMALQVSEGRDGPLVAASGAPGARHALAPDEVAAEPTDTTLRRTHRPVR